MFVPLSKRHFPLLGAVAVAISLVSFPASASKVSGGVSPDLQVCHTAQACLGWSNTTGGTAIHGDSRYGHGIVGTTHANPNGFGPGSSAVYGRDFTPYGFHNVGVTGISSVGTGVYGHSTEGAGVTGNGNPGVFGDGYSIGNGSWPGVIALGGTPESNCDNGYPCPPAMVMATNFVHGSEVNLFEAVDNEGNVIAYLDDSGNLHLTGQIYTSGSCQTGCLPVHERGGKQVTAYAPRATTQSVEDFGQAQLSQGEGYVRINPDFASTMDGSAPYLVFVTPHGDSRGLYVTGETASGFWVRENGGGRSTMSFDYRIVAKPVDANAPRLPRYEWHNLGRTSLGISMTRLRGLEADQAKP